MRLFIFYNSLILFFIFANIFNSAAQQNMLADSVLKLYQKSTSDTNRIALLNKLAVIYNNKSIDSAYKYSSLAVELVTKSTVSQQSAKALNTFGVLSLRLEKFNQAKQSLAYSLSMYVELKDTVGTSLVLNNLGNYYRGQGHFDVALNLLLESLKLKQLKGNLAEIASSHNNIGNIYDNIGMNDKALEEYRNSLSIYLKLNDSTNIATLCNNIGTSFKKNGQVDSALIYYTKGTSLASILNDELLYMSLLINTGLLYYEIQKTDLARRYLESGLLLSRKNNYIYGVVTALHNLGKMYYEEKNYQTSEELFSELLSYCHLDEYLDMQEITYFYLANIYAEKGDSEKAFSFLKQYIEIHDTLLSRFNTSNFNELEIKYDTEKKENMIKIQKAELEKKEALMIAQKLERKMLIIIIILVVFIVFWLFLNILRKNKVNKILSLQKEEILKQMFLLENQKIEIDNKSKRLEQANVELEKHRNHLEELVKERTGELEKSKILAEQADKLKTAFLANMSHEIRTPMNAIIGFANILKMKQTDEEQKFNLISLVIKNTYTLLHLIDNITVIAKIEAGIQSIETKQFNVVPLFKEIYESYKVALTEQQKAQIVFLLNVPEISECNIVTDKSKLKQIITTFLDNAIKFTEKGVVEFGYFIEYEPNKQICFFVKDSGIGIADDNLDIIFERFRKITGREKLYGGAGIGLYMASKFATLLNGKIEVKSKINEGSTFSLYLPLN